MSIIIKKYIYQKIGYLWLPWLLFKDGRQKFCENGSKDFSKTVNQIHFNFSGFIYHTDTYNDMGIYQYSQPLLPSKIYKKTPKFGVNLMNKNENISLLAKMEKPMSLYA